MFNNRKPPTFPGGGRPGNKKTIGMFAVLLCAGAGIYIGAMQTSFFRGEKQVSWHQKVYEYHEAVNLSAALLKTGTVTSPIDIAYFSLGCKPMGDSKCIFLPKQPGEERKLNLRQQAFAEQIGA